MTTDVKAMREFHEDAIAGEWKVYEHGVKVGLVVVAECSDYDDAVFIAAAHNAMPALLEEVETLRSNQRAAVIAWFDENKDQVVKDLGDQNGLLEKENDALRAERDALQTRMASLGSPLPVALFCPTCQMQHVDEGEWATRLHRTHRCVDGPFGKGCGHEWRTSNRSTVGVTYAELEPDT